jgi:hypothetical protein
VRLPRARQAEGEQIGAALEEGSAREFSELVLELRGSRVGSKVAAVLGESLKAYRSRARPGASRSPPAGLRRLHGLLTTGLCR